MISKEKLLNGYVKTDNKELVRLFLSECLKYDDIEFPIISCGTLKNWKHFAISTNMTPCCHGPKAINEKEELTLEDFKPKPKTKVTYELVTGMTSNEVAKSMINGEVFYSEDGTYRYIWDGKGFFDNHGCNIYLLGKFYRKVEKVIDWRYEAVRFVSENGTEAAEYIWDVDGVELNDESFIKLCHLVAELTDKPE